MAKGEHDGDGIIGDRPKPKSQTEGLGLFDSVPILEAHDPSTAPVIGRAVQVDDGFAMEITEEGRRFMEQPIDGDADEEDEDGGWAVNRDHADSLWDVSEPEAPDVPGTPDLSHEVARAKVASLASEVDRRVMGEPDDNPTDPTKPPAPTDAERLVAIERVKAAIVDDIIRLADKRRGLPLAQAGVTADDAHELAHKRPEAALIGAKGRAWSWLGPWLASLARRGQLATFRVEGVPVTRRSNRDKAHGNAHAVYLHPLDPRSPGQPRAGLASAGDSLTDT